MDGRGPSAPQDTTDDAALGDGPPDATSTSPSGDHGAGTAPAEATPTGTPPGGSAVAPPRRWRRGLAIAAVVSAVAIGLAAIDGALIYRRIDRVPVSVPDAPDGVTTWLLIGSDSRAAATSMPDPAAFGTPAEVPDERADVILLAQEGHDGRPARLVTVPRDLVVQDAEGGLRRIALTLLESVDAVVDAVCASLGVAVDHVALIRFDGIARLVDQVGGVPVEVAHPTRDLSTGLLLPAGPSVLDGAGAVAWARARHVEQEIGEGWVPDQRGESGRQENQRVLLRSVAEGAASRLRQPWRARGVARAVADAVTVDDDAGLVDLTRLLRLLASDPTEETLAHQASTGAVPIAVLDDAATEQLATLRTGLPAGSPCPDP